MNKAIIFGLPLLALVATAGLAAAHPFFNVSDMTDEEKGYHVQMLEEQQSMLQDQLAYLNGEITEDEFLAKMEAHHEAMSTLRESLGENGYGYRGGMRGGMHGGRFDGFGGGCPMLDDD